MFGHYEGAGVSPKAAACTNAACADRACSEGHRRGQEALEGGWVLFHRNVLAYLYKALYRRDVPPKGRVPGRVLRKLLPVLSEEQRELGGRIHHMFVALKCGRGAGGERGCVG